jgi:hypothetical protein
MYQKFYTVAQFCEKEGLTQGTVRMWIFNAKTNGFSKCIYRIGKKILISHQRYCEWMEDAPDNKEIPQEEVAGKKAIEDFLELNRKILLLNDKDLGVLFETGNNLIEEQRINTAGMIEALELVLSPKELQDSIRGLEEVMELMKIKRENKIKGFIC